MGFKGKLSKYFFSNGISYLFLVILIEIFILKTTMYHKYTLKYQEFTQKKKSLLSPINREFYLAKGTEKFILGRFLLSGILLMLLSLRPWGVAARLAILENRGAKSHFCDYSIIRARYLYLSYYRKCM
jgi:hypothetical protein